jgi:hypothetical protein
MSLMGKLQKASKIGHTSVLADSPLFGDKEFVNTGVPMMNVALSGDTEGGLTNGLTVLAGPSKHFKTSFALLMAGAYLKAKKDAVMLFYHVLGRQRMDRWSSTTEARHGDQGL